MGTPDFAAKSLGALLGGGFDVAGVFTQPDKPRNRGRKVSFSPVKEIAVSAGVPVFQPVTLKDGAALESLKSLEPELLVVVAYGKILPDLFLELPSHGCINIHASLLPKYRGAAPIQWAVLNGDKTTGVTSMYVAPELDSGDIIYSEETEIGEFETSGELFDRLRDMGAELLCRTVSDIAAGIAPRVKQDEAKATYVERLSKDMSTIDWGKAPREIVKKICGLDPWPVATAEIGGSNLRIFKAEYTNAGTAKTPGSVVSVGRRGIEIACGGGETLMITEVQAPNAKRMPAGDYLLGHKVEVSDASSGPDAPLRTGK